MRKVKSVTTTYIDSNGKETKETVQRDTSRDCLAIDEPNSGIKVGGSIIYADGSWRESSLGGLAHRPALLGGQYPLVRPTVILRYWEAFHERKSAEFDKLKLILERKGGTFQINKDDRSIDALERLKELQVEVQNAVEMYKQAEASLEEATPQGVRDAEQYASEEAGRKATFSAKVHKIELGTTIEKPQRSSRR